MKIKSVELALENCEVITIDKELLGFLYLGDLNTTFCKEYNSLLETTVCKDFAIEIHRDLSKNKETQYLFGQTDDERNPIERLLKYQDITQIQINFDNDSSKHYYAHWHDEDEYDNRYQYNKKNDFGDLYIVISEDKDFEHFFIDSLINDADYIEDNWKDYRS